MGTALQPPHMRTCVHTADVCCLATAQVGGAMGPTNCYKSTYMAKTRLTTQENHLLIQYAPLMEHYTSDTHA